MFRLLTNANFGTNECVSFLRQRKQNTKRPLILIGDRRLAHRSKNVHRFLAGPSRLPIELLPPYAPELHPKKSLCSYLKTAVLANNTPEEVERLRADAKAARCHVRGEHDLLKKTIRRCPLFR
jgi:transposase